MTQDFLARLHSAIARAGSPICVGLDPDPKKLPKQFGSSARDMRNFLVSLIEATRDLVAAYKPNTAFYEVYGAEGWQVLEELRNIIGPETLLLVDAKRGDVEHTNEAYAQALFEGLKADAVTVQPYLGGAPLAPFLRRPDKGAFVLCATSNPGAEEVQGLQVGSMPLYVEIARLAKSWSTHKNVGLVVGTTKPEALQAIVSAVPDLPLLMPGGGAQGGDTGKARQILKNAGATGLYNFSRDVMYASSGADFAGAARTAVERLRDGFRTQG
jgi:orotidine-5'-phosphate decarboxylase